MILRIRNSQVIAESAASRYHDSTPRVEPINIFNSPVGDWRFVNRNWFQFCRHLIRGIAAGYRVAPTGTINLPC